MATDNGKPGLQAKDRQFVTALARGLDILSCFSAATPSLGTADLSRMTGLPQATVWRLCHTLIEKGYLVQMDRKDKLRPGIPVLSLGYSAISTMPLAELARTEMQQLAVKIQGAVSLGARDGLSMVYLQRCQGAEIVLRNMVVGSRVPMLTSATGWAYMAGLSGEQLNNLFAQLHQEDAVGFKEAKPHIERALENYAATGMVINKGLLHPQIYAVGVPVISQDGGTVLALSCGGIAQLFNDTALKQAGNALKKLAGQISLMLSSQHKA